MKKWKNYIFMAVAIIFVAQVIVRSINSLPAEAGISGEFDIIAFAIVSAGFAIAAGLTRD